MNPKRGKRPTSNNRRKWKMFLVEAYLTEDVADTEINNYVLRQLKHTRIKSRLPVCEGKGSPDF